MYSTVEEIVADIEQQQKWDHLLREIKVTSAAYEFPCKHAKMQKNQNRNRYRDVSPYDHSRVKLMEGPNDYINSNLVHIEAADRRYILSQGPLPGTSGHLWQMVWEQNSRSIIMLNKIIEKGTRKCHQYWPFDKSDPMVFPKEGFKVSLISESDHHEFVIRELELVKTETPEQQSRIIYQFHYTAWPDFGVPESPAAFLNFLACVREYGVLENNVGPAVIHCSAGIGRSGTFALVDVCLVFLQKGIPFDIKETLLQMRKDRMGLIQTPQQLRFSYFAIAECERILKGKQDESDDSGSDTNSEDIEEEIPDLLDLEEKEDYTRESSVICDPIEIQQPCSVAEKSSCQTEEKENVATEEKADVPTEEKINVQEEEKTSVPTKEKVMILSDEKSEVLKKEKSTGSTEEKTVLAKLKEETVNHCYGNSVQAHELRRRKIDEKKENLQNHVQEIKQTMQAKEKKWPWTHYFVGGILTVVILGVAVTYRYRYR